MGAHVWKRESSDTCAQGVKCQSGPEGSSSAALSGNSTETGDVHNPLPKKQRLEATAAPASGPSVTGSPTSVAAAATATAAAGASVNEAKHASSNPSSPGAPQASHAPAPGQQHQRGRQGGRASGRGSSFAGRGRRHLAAAGRGSSHEALHTAADSTTAAVGGRGPGHVFAAARGRGAGRVGDWQFSGRGRGADEKLGSEHVSQQKQQQSSQAVAAAAEEALLAKERELAALKAKIAQQQAKQDALKAAQQLREQQQHQQQELQQRKNRLNSAFGSAFASAAKARQGQHAAAANTAGASGSPSDSSTSAEADEAEVKRVLSSKNDYDVLHLKPGCDRTALKKRYKEMAVRLHPDKCKAADASVAFQRAHKAYLTLQAHVL